MTHRDAEKMPELKPCPWCKSSPTVSTFAVPTQVRCENEKCPMNDMSDGLKGRFRSGWFTFDAWQNRATPPCDDGRGETFEEEFEAFAEWESEAYSRGVSIDDDDVEKLRLFFDFLQVRHFRAAPISVEVLEGMKKKVPYPHSFEKAQVRANSEVIGYNAAIDDVKAIIAKFKGEINDY